MRFRPSALAALLIAIAPIVGFAQAPTRQGPPDGFTFAAGGDLIGPYHTLVGVADSAFFNGVVPLFKRADVGFANQEGAIFELPTFTGFPAAENGGGIPQSPVAVAHDLKAMGISIVSKANNHATDWGPEGLLETERVLNESGIAFAGAGASLAAARAPGYLETPKGKVALVSTASTFTTMSVAGAPGTRRGTPTHARPGLSALHVEPIELRPADEISRIRSITYGTGAKPGPQVTVGGQVFRTAAASGLTWEMNKDDEAAIVASVHEARQQAVFVLFAIHAHETGGASEDPGEGSQVERSDEAQSPDDPRPADFEPRLFHEVIDAGADAVVRTGPHGVTGIEIYRGKPIFYGLGSLFFDFQGRRSYKVPSGQTLYFPDEWFQTIVPVVTYKNGVVSEIMIYPMSIESSVQPTGGAPHPASAAEGRRILDRLAKLSAAFGTTISIEGGVGVIRPR